MTRDATAKPALAGAATAVVGAPPVAQTPGEGPALGLDVLILRDPRESKKKCSLTPLRGRPDVTFVRYDAARRVNAHGRILLDPEGAPFDAADRGAGLLVIDCSWRRVASLRAQVDGDVRRRRLPALQTAYPRVSRNFADPPAGLASIEALFVASVLVGAPDLSLLAAYRWREEFLAANAAFVAAHGVRPPPS